MPDADSFAALYAPPQAALADRPGAAAAGTMRVEYDFTKRDMLHFRVTRVAFARNFHIIGLVWGAIIIWTMFGLGSISAFLGETLLAYLGFMGFMLFLQVAVTLLMKSGIYITHHAVELREDGFYDETRYFRGLNYWGGIHRVVHRTGYVAVYSQVSSAYVIPNRAFGGDMERGRFLEIAQKRMLAAKEKLGS